MIVYETYVSLVRDGEEVTAHLATQIRALRGQRGWSMQQLAAAAEVHPSTIHLIEQGKRGLTVATAIRLAEALDVRLSDLIRGAEDATR